MLVAGRPSVIKAMYDMNGTSPTNPPGKRIVVVLLRIVILWVIGVKR